MHLTYRRKRISGILAVIPERELSFDEEMKNYQFPEARSLKLKKMMGYDKRRIVEPGVCFSDLAVFGLNNLFERGLLAPHEIDALLVVTNSPDYLMPPTSNVIQGRLCLRQDIMCLDISQACAGFVIGLMQSFSMLAQESIRKVVLINGDLFSRKTSPRDRSLSPLVGDAVTITVIENDSEDSVIHAAIKMDGSLRDALIIPAGGLRLPCSSETSIEQDYGDNNFRAKDHLRMEGSVIFNFTQSAIPLLIKELLERAGATIDEVDYFLCHQPNRFMLQKLADKMGIPYTKMPNNVVEHFGNSSSANIPIAAALNISGQLMNGNLLACLVGYGAGLTWTAMLTRMGNLKFCEIIELPSKT